MKARVCALLSRGFSTGSSLAAIKKLRDLSGAPIGDVKKALEETSYDFGGSCNSVCSVICD